MRTGRTSASGPRAKSNSMQVARAPEAAGVNALPILGSCRSISYYLKKIEEKGDYYIKEKERRGWIRWYCWAYQGAGLE